VSDDIGLDEKRVYADSREGEVAYVASDTGLARVESAGDQIGRFGLVRRGTVRDVAGGNGRLVVATPEDALVGTGDGFAETGFGPAVAVGVDGSRTFAAGPDGLGELVGNGWRTVADVSGVRVIDGNLVVAEEACRIPAAPADGADLQPLGVGNARDVAAAGPYVAAAEGLYRVNGDANGTSDAGSTDTDDPTRVREGSHEVVAADSQRAHAVGDEQLYERTNGERRDREDEEGGETWIACETPVEGAVVDVAYGESVYAVTGSGTVLVDADPEQTPDGHGGWRSRALGLAGACAIAVP